MNDARLGTAVPWFSNIRLKVGLICGRVQDKPSCVRMIRGGYTPKEADVSGPAQTVRSVRARNSGRLTSLMFVRLMFVRLAELSRGDEVASQHGLASG